MTISLSEVLPYITAALGAGLGWLWKELVSIRKTAGEDRKAHADHRTHVAERYVTKDDMQMALSRVYSSLDRIEQKLDQRT